MKAVLPKANSYNSVYVLKKQKTVFSYPVIKLRIHGHDKNKSSMNTAQRG